MMMLVVGLGNPGEEYKNTRHNVGYMVIDKLSKDLGLDLSEKGKFNAKVAKGEGVVLVKPLSYMNKSGEVVSRLVNFYKVLLDEVFVVFDDLDLRLGNFKLQKSKGPGDHNGLLSVERQLGDDDFWRLRVGIDNRVNREVEGKDYVLDRFRKEERKKIDKVIEEVIEELKNKR